MPTILIGADICPIEANRPYFMKGDAKSLLHDLLPEFQQADLVMANLECPLIEQQSPIAKTGPVFGEPSACINGVREAGIDILCLANNHSLDHGAAGLKNTMEVCANAGIATVGAGANLGEARKILIRDVEGLRIGVLAVAEHEFSIAGSDSWGANPLDLIDFVRNVKSHRDSLDYLVVVLHGGDEFHVPSPRIKDTCRFMIEMGANAVIVQHPHCLGGCEEYQSGHIVYGQGALIMDEALYRDRASFHEGFLVRLNVADDCSSRMEIVPFVQSAPAPGARRMAEADEDRFRRSLSEVSSAVLDDKHVQAEWLRFCQDKRHAYVSGLLGYGRLLRKLNSRGHLTRLYGRRAMLGVRNLLYCETHREALETVLKHRMP